MEPPFRVGTGVVTLLLLGDGFDVSVESSLLVLTITSRGWKLAKWLRATTGTSP